MIRRIGGLIIDGGWSVLWDCIAWPVKGGLLYVSLLGVAYAIGKVVA